jgi:hypothetical protein
MNGHNIILSQIDLPNITSKEELEIALQPSIIQPISNKSLAVKIEKE